MERSMEYNCKRGRKIEELVPVVCSASIHLCPHSRLNKAIINVEPWKERS